MLLRVLNQILDVPKSGTTPRANLARFGLTELILVTLRDSYEWLGGYIWGLFSKNIEF